MGKLKTAICYPILYCRHYASDLPGAGVPMWAGFLCGVFGFLLNKVRKVS